MSRQNYDRKRFAPIRLQEFCTHRRIAKGEEESFKTKWRATKMQEVIKRPSKIMTKDGVESLRAPVKHCVSKRSNCLIGCQTKTARNCSMKRKLPVDSN